jgi:hypothetical protein
MAEKEEDTQIVAVDTAAIRAASPEIDMQITTAKTYPRSIKKVLNEALSMATIDEETAATMEYAVPKAGKIIRGPSIRLAEIFAIAWGNLRAETRILDAGKTHVSAEAMCWDLEKNVAIKAETRRRITDKHNKRYSADMIMTTGSAGASIALRNVIQHIVPRSYINNVLRKAVAVAQGKAKNLTEVRQKWIESFKRFGVVEDQVLERLERASIEDVTAEDVQILRGFFTAIREDGVDVTEIFPPVESEANKAKKAALKAKLAKGRTDKTEAKAPPKKEEPPLEEGESLDESTGEIVEDPDRDPLAEPDDLNQTPPLQTTLSDQTEPEDEAEPEESTGKLRIKYIDLCEAASEKTGSISAMSREKLLAEIERLTSKLKGK